MSYPLCHTPPPPPPPFFLPPPPPPPPPPPSLSSLAAPPSPFSLLLSFPPPLSLLPSSPLPLLFPSLSLSPPRSLFVFGWGVFWVPRGPPNPPLGGGGALFF